MKISKRQDHSTRLFVKRTLSAQLHTLGFILMLVGAAVLLPLAHKLGPLHFWSCLSFIGTGALVFLVSSFYHYVSDGFHASTKLEAFLENLDHYSIYLFIAGTYSPFLLSAVSESWRIPLLISVWTVALLGILYTWVKPRLPRLLQHRAVYTGLFVLMGWIMLIRIEDVWAQLSTTSLLFLAGGSLAYSLGAIVYSTKKPRLFEGFFGFHELWHLMVLLGAGFHFFMILSFYKQ